ncbi:FIG00657500: hypothetical protein [hydrothermal vent metagenome]|uniref:DUF4381 domain-containing protein n=1 Tax=hydrothermal vent metagenome TaxID=652676 RepID=A0A3B1AQD6_9ZZZZ
MNPAPQELPLRDIHLPDPISWWPLAPGWWGLLALILLLIGLFLLGRYLYRRRVVRRAARKALALLQTQHQAHQDDHRLAIELSVLLRRISLSQYPREDVASLTGATWLHFLDQGLEKHKLQGGFATGAGQILANAPYQPVADLDTSALLELCTAWVNALPPTK